MTRRGLRAAQMVVGAGVLLGASVASSGEAHTRFTAANVATPCRSVGAKPILRAGEIQVFRTPLTLVRTHTESGGPAHYDTVYACWTPTGRRTILAHETPDDYTQVKVLAVRAATRGNGPFVAISTAISSRSGYQVTLMSRNVRTRATLHRNGRDVDRFTSAAINMSISSILVTPNGSLAWIGTGNCPQTLSSAAANGPVTGVYAIGVDGREVAEQCGAPTAPKTTFTGLSYAALKLFWRADGHQMSTALR